MSSALAKAAPLKAEIRLAQAVSLFEANLPAEHKAAFQAHRAESSKSPPDTCDVMRLTAEIDRRATGRAGGRCFGPRLTNILQAIQQFAALGDVLVGASQNVIACGVWSLVRMTLLSIVNLSSYFEKTSAFLMIAGRSAPRYQEMALLYPRSKSLQSQLSEYFIVIVHLCHQLLKMSRKSVLGQLLSFPSDADLKSYQSELDQWANSIREEINLLMGQSIKEQSSNLKSLLKFSEYQLHRQRQRARIRVLAACSTYDHQTAWKQIRKAGKTTLFGDMPEYRNWKAQTESYTLVWEGKLGSGKSVLLANVVDNLNLDTQSAKHTVAYFFCRHDISESLKVDTIICSLVRQLLHSIPDLTMAEKLVDGINSVQDCERALSVLQLMRQLVLPSDFKAYFVLDGLDECDGPQIRTLTQHLRGLQDVFTLLICVSSRVEADYTSRLTPNRFAKHSTIAIPDDNPDIKAFINAELGGCIESGKLTIGDPTLILEIEDVLLRGAQGMFLWVALQIESLCAARTDDAIRQALLDLPKDLSQTFSRILQRSGELGIDDQTRTLQLITVAYRPLTIEELREALSVVPGNVDWNPVRLLNNIYSVLACCGCLIVVDEEDSTVRLVHHSVKQFLLGEFKDSAIARFTKGNANRMMVNIIITYLNYDVFETQVSTAVAPQLEGLAEAVPHRIVHSIDAPRNVRRLALKLLQSRRKPEFNIGKVLAEAGQNFRPPSADQFRFFSYAKSYWARHLWFISEHETAMRGLLLGLAKRTNLVLDLRDDKVESLLLRAAQKGDEGIVRLLLSKGADTESKSPSFDQTPLSWAAEDGKKAPVRFLPCNSADIELKDFEFAQTPLSLAAENGHKAVVEFLLDRGADIESKSSSGRTPLSWASRNGHKAVVELLLDKGADVESKSNNGKTPLLWAAMGGHEAVVELLLGKGADIESESNIGHKPLFWAAMNGHKAVVKLLLDKGAYVNSKPVDGSTPLEWAARNGHQEIVKLLGSKGADV